MAANLADNCKLLKGMLPDVDSLFTLVRQLAQRSQVTDVAVPKWLVQRHGLGPLTARAGMSAYRTDLVRAMVQWGRIERDLPPIVGAFRANRLRVVPLKGASYANWLYEKPAERPMSDIDLMVQGHQRDQAERVLTELGFQRSTSAALHHAAPWTRRDIVVDLHWNIIAPGRSRIDLDAVWSRTQPGWPDGADRLEDVDALAFHLVHLARNRMQLPLINVVDAARLFERARGDVATARATEWGLALPVRLALRFCVSILDDLGGSPAGWLGPSRADAALLTEPSAAKKIVFDLASAGSPRQLAARLVHFAANKAASRGT